MRNFIALLAVLCLAACNSLVSPTDHAVKVIIQYDAQVWPEPVNVYKNSINDSNYICLWANTDRIAVDTISFFRGDTIIIADEQHIYSRTVLNGDTTIIVSP